MRIIKGKRIMHRPKVRSSCVQEVIESLYFKSKMLVSERIPPVALFALVPSIPSLVIQIRKDGR